MLIVGHQVTVNCFRYLFERMTEAQILAIDQRADVPNCSVTSYVFDPSAGRQGKLVLRPDLPSRRDRVPPQREPGPTSSQATPAT